MTCCVDFHTHSTASDGQLSPSELVLRARDNGVRHLALTDHDTTAGLAEARASAERIGVDLIPGVEISVTWETQCLHIVGVAIDPQFPPLIDALDALQKLRIARAAEMGRKLEKKGIVGAYAGASERAGKGMITRTHFAKYLVDRNYCSTIQKAFDLYLSRGKAGYVQTRWIDFDKGISLITAAGGMPILAHPRRYKLTVTRMRKLLGDFRAAGGKAIEVVCGNSNRDDIRDSARYAREFGLLGSLGSDFHSPASPWIEIGRLKPLPDGVEPVWKALGIRLSSVAAEDSGD